MCNRGHGTRSHNGTQPVHADGRRAGERAFLQSTHLSLRCESGKYEQSDLAIQTIALMRIKTRHRDQRISDALDATSQRQRFALPRYGASYSLLV
jgi:hypothetical protein